MKTIALLLTTAAVAVSAPAMAATTFTFNFNTGSGNHPAVNSTSNGATLTATAWRVSPFATDLGNLTSLSQLTQTPVGSQPALDVTRSSGGIGVRGGANSQLDTNSTNRQEALLFTSTQAFGITGLRLGVIDANDTLQIYGVNADDTLVSLGYGGVIAGGLGGAAATWSTVGGVTTLTLKERTDMYTRFLFTTAERGDLMFAGDKGQGYLVSQISGAVPEPGTWALMIGGFGLVGASLRRRTALAAA